MKTVGIIGAGTVGTTLGILLSQHSCTIKAIYSRTQMSVHKAISAIGAGTAIASLDQFPAVDILLLTTNDASLAEVAHHIAEAGFLKQGAIGLHCSGALPSSILLPLKNNGAQIASVHPVKSFTDPSRDAQNFAGTWCGIEGDKGALDILAPLFEAMGGQVFSIDPNNKTLYHTGTVMACNYLAPLMESALQCHEAAGIDRETSLKILGPLVQNTIANILSLGPVKALTGPVARGDSGVVEAQIAALEKRDPHLAQLYAFLAQLALPLAKEKGVASESALQKLQDALMQKKLK